MTPKSYSKFILPIITYFILTGCGNVKKIADSTQIAYYFHDDLNGFTEETKNESYLLKAALDSVFKSSGHLKDTTYCIYNYNILFGNSTFLLCVNSKDSMFYKCASYYPGTFQYNKYSYLSQLDTTKMGAGKYLKNKDTIHLKYTLTKERCTNTASMLSYKAIFNAKDYDILTDYTGVFDYIGVYYIFKFWHNKNNELRFEFIAPKNGKMVRASTYKYQPHYYKDENGIIRKKKRKYEYIKFID